MNTIHQISALKNLWEEGGYKQWHEKEVHPCLLQHCDKLLPPMILAEHGNKTRSVLVPLCGKSTEMLWLADLGYRVVGIEAVSIAITTFFEENHIPYEIHTVEYKSIISGKAMEAVRYCSRDKKRNITIYQMDIFEVTLNIVGGPFEAVFDKGALVAINHNYDGRGRRYVEVILSLLAPGASCILESYCFADGIGPIRGHPNHTPESVIQDLYGSKCGITLLSLDEESNQADKVYGRVWYLLVFNQN